MLNLHKLTVLLQVKYGLGLISIDENHYMVSSVKPTTRKRTRYATDTLCQSPLFPLC